MHLGILTSHPIQYQAPWFRALAKICDLEVFFAHRQTASEQGKAGFGVEFEWDVDLLSGYKHTFIKNISASPGVECFSGCDTPAIGEIIRSKRAEASGREVKRFDAFIVCGWYLKCYRQAIRGCRAADVPVLVRGDSQLGTPRSWPKRLVMEVRQRWLLRQFDGFLTVGQRNREYLEHFGARPETIFFIPHFVDNEWFSAKAETAKKRKADIRNQWGASENTLVILFVGKFQRIKRPGDILRAMSLMSSQEPNVGELTPDGNHQLPIASESVECQLGINKQSLNFMAVFVGSGELEEDLRLSAEKLGVHARFAGFKNQSELPAYYVAADVLVLSSESETWGLVVNEAMACGLPAIVSDAVGCAPDLIEEGKTGFTFKLGNTAELADNLSMLANMKLTGHDFAPALKEKMRVYSLQNAVLSTMLALQQLVINRRR